jgi:hypothetical protein
LRLIQNEIVIERRRNGIEMLAGKEWMIVDWTMFKKAM